MLLHIFLYSNLMASELFPVYNVINILSQPFVVWTVRPFPTFCFYKQCFSRHPNARIFSHDDFPQGQMLRHRIAVSKFMHIFKVINRFCNSTLQKCFTNLPSLWTVHELSVCPLINKYYKRNWNIFVSLIDKMLCDFLLLVVGVTIFCFVDHLYFFFHELLT